jgi:hypothetical protein
MRESEHRDSVKFEVPWPTALPQAGLVDPLRGHVGGGSRSGKLGLGLWSFLVASATAFDARAPAARCRFALAASLSAVRDFEDAVELDVALSAAKRALAAAESAATAFRSSLACFPRCSSISLRALSTRCCAKYVDMTPQRYGVNQTELAAAQVRGPADCTERGSRSAPKLSRNRKSPPTYRGRWDRVRVRGLGYGLNSSATVSVVRPDFRRSVPAAPWYAPVPPMIANSSPVGGVVPPTPGMRLSTPAPWAVT